MAVAVLAMVVSGAFAADTQYRVQWIHPFKAGNSERVHLIVDQTLESIAKRSSGEQRKTSKRRIEFSGSFVVQEVDDKGAPSKVRVTIDKATQQIDTAAKQDLARPGTVVDAELKDGKAQLKIDPTTTLPAEAQPLIAVAIAYPFDEAARLDEIIGVVEPQGVGESWPASTGAIIKRIASDFDPKLEPTEVKGTAKLAKVSKAGDKESLDIDYQYRADSDRPFAPPIGATSDINPGSSTYEAAGTAEALADRSGMLNSHLRIKTERKYKSKPDERDRSKTPIDNIFRHADVIDLRIDYPGAGPAKKSADK